MTELSPTARSAGSGKSLALLSIVRWAKATGWLTVSRETLPVAPPFLPVISHTHNTRHSTAHT